MKHSAATEGRLGLGGWLLAYLARWILTALFHLNRVVVVGEESLAKARADGQPVFVGFWHGRLLYAAWYLRPYGTTTLVSQSRDGEIIARILRGWGLSTIRGSSRRGSETALRRMMRAMEQPQALLAITMDGPIGPARVAKAGSLALAAKKKAVLIPMSGSASRSWTFTKSWDQFQLPKPFGRIVIQFGPPIHIEPGMDEDALARLMGERVTALEQETDAVAASMV